MADVSEKLLQRLSRSGIMVCQTLFLAMVMTSVLSLAGLANSDYYSAALGGTLIFTTTLTYFRLLGQNDYSVFIKFALAGISTCIAGAGIAIAFGIIHQEYSLALKTLPFIVITPLVLVLLQTSKETARSSR